MSYQSEVLADNPVLYYRLDVGGSGVNGESVPDLGSAGLNATLNFSGSQAPWGLASPIETDPASREFWGYANANIDPFLFTGSSYITRASDSALTISGDFAVECWLRPMADIPFSSDFGVCAKESTGGLLLTSSSGTRFGGFVYDNAGTLFKVVDTSLLVTDYLTESFHCVVERVGNSLAFYRNGVLRATTTVTSGLPTRFLANPFYVHPGGSFYLNLRLDEAALYTTSLGGARWLAHYEAAKAVLPLRATITIRTSVELDTDQITPENIGFPHNYSETFGDGQIPIVEELQYKTNVNQSEPDYQQRVNARPHGAYRSLEYHLSPSGAAARTRLQSSLYTPAETYCIPVWSDSGVLTAQATASDGTISCDTTKRDYQVGSYVGICSDLQNPTTYQFFKITVVADALLTIATTVGTTVANASPVFPARLATISDDSLAIKSYAADHEDGVFRFDVLETELSTRRVTAYTPSTTYLSTEVFTLESAKYSFLDAKPYDISRRIQASGRDYQYARDTGSPQTFPVRFLLTTRAALSEFYGWIDARQGKQNPLWVSTKEKDLICAAAVGGHAITVNPKSGFSLHHGRRHIEIQQDDGTLSRWMIDSVTDNGTTETWHSPDTFPNSALTRVSFLKYCVLAQDSIQIRYFKGGSNGAIIAECSLSFRELLTSPDS